VCTIRDKYGHMINNTIRLVVCNYFIKVFLPLFPVDLHNIDSFGFSE